MSKVVPFSLKDAPSLIESIFPAQKVSVESQKERKANVGQTLTVLGAYWKGRKPLVLVRACVLAALLPTSKNSQKDLEIFEILVGMSELQVNDRFKTMPSLEEILTFANNQQKSALVDEENGISSLKRIPKPVRESIGANILSSMPYQQRISHLSRPEEIDEDILTKKYMKVINDHLGTNANDINSLIEQLGIMRYGRRPIIGDTFCGGGSIPFEAARLGCDVYASDLNPVACMLTWGSLNILGRHFDLNQSDIESLSKMTSYLDEELIRLGVETNSEGDRAKAFLYCVEVTCPITGWRIPLLGSLIISTDRRCAAVLVPNFETKVIEVDVKYFDEATWKRSIREFAKGTISGGNVTYSLNGESYSTPLSVIRGDRRNQSGVSINSLRAWEKEEFCPRSDDIFRERLYCIQWIKKSSIANSRQETYFSAVSADDIKRENIVEEFMRKNIHAWQESGYIPETRIEPGSNTSQPIWERGWSHWHHLFGPRNLLTLGIVNKYINEIAEQRERPVLVLALARALDRASKLCQWSATPAQDIPLRVFVNQALNTLLNWGVRANGSFHKAIELDLTKTWGIHSQHNIRNVSAKEIANDCDVFITDPPYADAVNYHEITEYFIGWIKKNPPDEFSDWTWDSRRPLAIKGDGEDFRKGMIDAYSAMADHMPDNGLQIVMFTHQSTSVWADMAQIFWGSGLRVMAAWYIATETTSELKKGGYVQGTVILVLRKRLGNESGYKDEIVQEVKSEVAEQIDTMVGLNQTLKGNGRIENLFEDADLQMAGYAAALRVLTRYTKIDGTDMTKEALRPRVRGEKSLVNEIVEYAVQVANEHMVPEGISTRLWEGLSGSERFYLKMVDIESVGLKKLDNYQNFAKAFRVDDFQVLMGKMEANSAHLKSARDFKKSVFEGSEFATSRLRALLYAIYQTGEDVEGDQVLSELKELIPNYMTSRDDLMEMAGYLSKQWLAVNEGEARSAEIVRGLIKNERFG